MLKPWTLTDFVRESNRIEGIGRVLPREIKAHGTLLGQSRLSVADMQEFVSAVAPGHRLRDQIGLNVRVGDYVAPGGGPEIAGVLATLLIAASNRLSDPYAVHVAYERLHPFTDGNGRSGRALWLWMHGGQAPIGFLHRFYYETLAHDPQRDGGRDERR